MHRSLDSRDTYLWIQGRAVPCVQHVVRCWASLFTPRAIGYRARLAVALDDLAMGVVVQQMVPADAAGVMMMTLEPVGGDRSQIYVEAAYGLGEGRGARRRRRRSLLGDQEFL